VNITVVIPSRGRVRGLSAVIYGLHFLESGKHNVTYGVACDDDDPETSDFCKQESKRVRLAYRIGKRHTSMGEMVNTMAQLIPADVYLVINDDVLCLSNNWDDVIAQAAEKTPHGVFWWTSACEQQVLFPIVTEKWRAAAGGIFSDFFPFWYDDLCLVELWTMTTDAESIILPINICDKPRTVTHRMRELTFWQKVYNGTRKLRVQKAYEMAEKLGLKRPDSPQHLAALLNLHLRRVSDEWINLIEHNQGDKNPPDAAYLKKRAEAEKMLNEIGENKEIPIAA
jgi:hypothetical protein